MKFPFRILLKKQLLLLAVFMLSCNAVFSFESEPSTNQSHNLLIDVTPATLIKNEMENKFVYSFHALSAPEKDILEKSLESFKKIDGFISLSVNNGNLVEIITSKSISQVDRDFVLVVSARLYGYIGFQIV